MISIPFVGVHPLRREITCLVALTSAKCRRHIGPTHVLEVDKTRKYCILRVDLIIILRVCCLLLANEKCNRSFNEILTSVGELLHLKEPS